MFRREIIYVVVTVGRKLNSYKVCKRRPKHLAQNQFAYSIPIEINQDDWLDRIEEIEVPKVKPPNLPKPQGISIVVEKETPLEVLDRLQGTR